MMGSHYHVRLLLRSIVYVKSSSVHTPLTLHIRSALHTLQDLLLMESDRWIAIHVVRLKVEFINDRYESALM